MSLYKAGVCCQNCQKSDLKEIKMDYRLSCFDALNAAKKEGIDKYNLEIIDGQELNDFFAAIVNLETKCFKCDGEQAMVFGIIEEMLAFKAAKDGEKTKEKKGNITYREFLKDKLVYL